MLSEAWAKRADPGIKLEVTLPQSVVREALEFVEDRLTPEEASVVQKLVQRLITTAR